jgi:starch phosphorylase
VSTSKCNEPGHGLASRAVTSALWFPNTYPDDDNLLVAYFCAEFGIAADIPIYSGGLGILAGDHLKAASELAIPLVAVGLFYFDGYFTQQIDADGQHERYTERTAADIGAEPVVAADGEQARVAVELPGGDVVAAVWKLAVGRVTLLLLDANIPDNDPETRQITSRLYGGDRTMRIRQELLLGIGGVRALAAAAITPTVFHINEGHSVFLQLERLRVLLADGWDADAALDLVRRTSIFTTHTPVPAGNEVFTDALATEYLAAAARGAGMSIDELIALGKVDDEDDGFGLTPLALRTTGRANGVSKLHGAVAREMWHGLWPERPVDDVPIGAVTNGVHVPTWLERGIAELAQTAGVELTRPAAPYFINATRIPDAALWAAHRSNVARLVDLANARGAVAGAKPRLDHDALTIGFSRRFATYKRAGLLFRDPDRLARLLDIPDRPVQIVLAGKAHPADADGKQLIAMITEFAADPRMRGRVVFVPDYDISIGAHILQGSDVWLNTPRLPMEASGTSGMKAAINGALNLSILDGWWAEGYDPAIGWAIDDGTIKGDDDEQDDRDHASLMRLLEDAVVPCFYQRNPQGIPPGWTAMMRHSIAQVGEEFSAARMLRDYTDGYYIPAHHDREPA